MTLVDVSSSATANEKMILTHIIKYVPNNEHVCMLFSFKMCLTWFFWCCANFGCWRLYNFILFCNNFIFFLQQRPYIIINDCMMYTINNINCSYFFENYLGRIGNVCKLLQVATWTWTGCILCVLHVGPYISQTLFQSTLNKQW